MQSTACMALLGTGSAPTLQLPHRLRSDPRTQDAIIIALADQGFGLSKQPPSYAFGGLVKKPCSPDTLALAIRDVFAHRRIANEAGRST